MATGISNTLTKQIGEHLVTAELGRRGIVATPFAGNVTDIDILSYSYENQKTNHIQVKAINKGSWQFDIRKFLDLEIIETKQIINGINKNLDRKIICIFISIGKKLGDDRFYIFKHGWLQDYFSKGGYTAREMPKNINSFHCALWIKDVQEHLNKWEIVTNEKENDC